MRFFSQLVGAIRVFERPLVMPVSRWVIAFFVVFGGGAMRPRRQFMLFGGFSM